MFGSKILCIGTNDVDTDVRTSELARTNNTKNHGLITDSDYLPVELGFYHSTIVDVSFGGLITLSKQFDQVILLDQPKDQWTNWKLLLSSYKLMIELDNLGISTEYKNNHNIQSYKLFDQLVTENKSFCIYPWINYVDQNNNLTLCARSSTVVTSVDKLKNWQTNPEYSVIRNRMLAGEPMPEACRVCYDYESKGIESYRQFETKEWVSKLGINSIDDLNNITDPVYYELRLSNKCNIKCRSCNPAHSHLIAEEFNEHKIFIAKPDIIHYSTTDRIDISKLTPISRVYLTGGEPTVMAEVYSFMRNCIEQGKTDFEFTIGTNAVKLNPTFLELADNFTNMNFSISLDGYGKINDYWRSGSDWDTVIKNSHILESRGHNISINCVPGIYNVTNLHLLFEFLDREFPHANVYLQINNYKSQSAFNHPNSQLVVESMKRCMQTKTYYADGKSNKTCIDSLYNYYSQNPTCNLDDLKAFFELNDRLDSIRNTKLIDYIPELEACRSLVQTLVDK